MSVTIKLDTSGFNQMAYALAKRVSMSVPDVVRSEAGVVLKASFNRTTIGRIPVVDAQSRLRASQIANKAFGVSQVGKRNSVQAGGGYVVAGLRRPSISGRMWLRSWRGPAKGRQKFILVGLGVGQKMPKSARRGPQRIGQATMMKFINAQDIYHHQLNLQTAAGRRTLGLAKQSWMHIAQSLNIDIANVRGGGVLNPLHYEQAKQALALSGKAYQNGYSFTANAGHKFSITLVNTLPWAFQIKMDAVLKWVISGRVKSFEKLIALSLDKDLNAIRKAFPNL